METFSNYSFRYKKLTFFGGIGTATHPVVVVVVTWIKSDKVETPTTLPLMVENQCDFLVVSCDFSFTIITVWSCLNQLRTGFQISKNLRTEN